MRKHITTKGFTFVELLITIAIIGLVFGGITTATLFIFRLVSETKVKTSATALANERIEYIRSLSYNSVGTIAGIPSGPIPQRSTSTLNGFIFHERVLIQYVDAPEDGLGGSDINGILADYKQVKVEYSWAGTNGTSSVFLLTNVVPPGIETTTGGGTITVNVFDADVLPVQGAAVRLFNNTGTTSVDTTRNTNIDGIAMFAGAPEGANYEITVTKANYSTDQTYSATTSNPNPITPHVAVLESTVSTMNFQIDRVSDLLVRTVGPAVTDLFYDTFTDTSGVPDSSRIYASYDVDVTGGGVVLGASGGFYKTIGTVLSVPVIPAVVDSWDIATWEDKISANTGILVQVYGITGTSTYTLIPDSDLPGNSVGFSSSPVVLTSLDPSVYPGLALGATLTTSNTAVTPELEEWEINYIISEPAVGNVPFMLTGSKTIGTTMSALPIYKYQVNHTTTATGALPINDLEWDLYTPVLTTASYDIRQICANAPFVLAPGTSETMTLTVVPDEPYTLRISINDSNEDPIVGASVTVSRSGFSEVETTSTCGQVFLNTGLTAAADYQVDVSAPGYTSQTITGVNMSGDESLVVTLVAS